MNHSCIGCNQISVFVILLLRTTCHLFSCKYNLKRIHAVADPRFALGGAHLPSSSSPSFLLPPSFLSLSSPSFLPLLSMEFLGVGGLEPPCPHARSAHVYMDSYNTNYAICEPHPFIRATYCYIGILFSVNLLQHLFGQRISLCDMDL